MPVLSNPLNLFFTVLARIGWGQKIGHTENQNINGQSAPSPGVALAQPAGSLVRNLTFTSASPQ